MAQAKPMPRLDPVTSARRPLRSNNFVAMALFSPRAVKRSGSRVFHVPRRNSSGLPRGRGLSFIVLRNLFRASRFYFRRGRIRALQKPEKLTMMAEVSMDYHFSVHRLEGEERFHLAIGEDGRVMDTCRTAQRPSGPLRRRG